MPVVWWLREWYVEKVRTAREVRKRIDNEEDLALAKNTGKISDLDYQIYHELTGDEDW